MEITQKEFDYAAFGYRLKEAREKAGLTQAQACEAVGLLKAQVLSSYERGISNPPIDVLAALARLYGISLDDLVFADEKPQKELTTGDWLYLLTRAADHLMLVPCTENKGGYDLKYNASAELSWGKNSIYSDFLDKWKKLRDAWIDELIDSSDYHHLMHRHSSQVPDDPEFVSFQARSDELFEKMESDFNSPLTDLSARRSALSRFISLVLNPRGE